ncbi:MAG TPA: RcnB family protein [Sphingomicrobium sp.]|nr:RcnB family protein [Sphingomicrobium sp.]
MRKLILPLLLASAAASPALAQPESDSSGQRAERSERSERGEARAQRSERSERSERADRPERAQVGGATVDREPRPQWGAAPERGGANAQPVAAAPAQLQQRREAVRQREARAAASGEFGERRDGTSGERAERRQEGRERIGDQRQWRGGTGDLRQSSRNLPRVMENRIPVVSNTPREGTQPPQRIGERRHSTQRWNTAWRHDRRYDWYNWRQRNRSLFRVGIYYDPFGWGYRPYQIGWRLWPSYYSSRYWIYDPWQYRLPYAPPGYRWIRYWDDAVLVDTWTGEVVDVIYNFFW